MYILDIRKTVLEFGYCDIRCIGALPPSISNILANRRLREPSIGICEEND
jgi:hypothetical protein